jgi:hypothetical protein
MPPDDADALLEAEACALELLVCADEELLDEALVEKALVDDELLMPLDDSPDWELDDELLDEALVEKELLMPLDDDVPLEDSPDWELDDDGTPASRPVSGSPLHVPSMQYSVLPAQSWSVLQREAGRSRQPTRSKAPVASMITTRQLCMDELQLPDKRNTPSRRMHLTASWTPSHRLLRCPNSRT